MKVIKPKLRSPIQTRNPVRVSTQAGFDTASNLKMAFPVHMGNVVRTQSPLVSLNTKLSSQPLRMTAADWRRRFFPKAQRNSLMAKVGAFVAKQARDLISYRKNPRLSSKPGQPPHAHKPGSRRWFRQIEFGMYQGGVIVGSVYFPNKGNTNLTVPEAQEHGGQKIINFRNIKSVSRGKDTRVRSRQEIKAIREGIRQGDIKTQSRSVVGRYKKRQFMQPALVKTQQKNRQLFRGQLR